MTDNIRMNSLKITELISSTEIQSAIDRLARQIELAYVDTDEVAVVVLLEGARRFSSDLFQRITNPKFKITHVKASSYNGTTQSSGQVAIVAPPDLAIQGKEILLVDDIYDTGHTMTALINWLNKQGAAQIKTAVLLVKNRGHEHTVPIDFHALEVEDLFVVGYGLDYQERYRELDYIGILNNDYPAD